MLELFPQGFEEIDHADGVELVAYTDSGGEERLWQAFGGASAAELEPGWEDAWRRFHRPARIGRLWVGPPWLEPDPGAVAVVIDPGRAFGTGAHATTRLCLELIAAIPPGSLLDVGCGSGVLAIAAGKLGHGPLAAMDVDPAAIEATRANAEANGVEIDVRLLDAIGADELPRADTVVANITADDVSRLPALDATRAVTSGYLASDTVSLPGFLRVDRRETEGWAADLHARAE